MSDSSDDGTAAGAGWGEGTDREGRWELVQIKVILSLLCFCD
jgi:hypothetical protein